jgi:hypothetical protein
MKSESSQGFPDFLQGMLEGGQRATDDVIRRAFNVTREDFLNYTGQWVGAHYGRVQ